MPDREKVIKELEILRDICNAKSNMAIGKGKIAWAGYANTADDAISLLNGQEPVSPWTRIDIKPDDVSMVINCGACHTELARVQRGVSFNDVKEYVKYCIRCGRAVKWDD